MEISPPILILVGFILVLLGIGAGMLLSTLTEEEEPQEDGSGQAPPGGQKGRYSPVARLWRDTSTNALVVEVEGKTYLGPNTLDELQRGRLESSARDLRAWLGMGRVPDAPPMAAPATLPAVEAPAPVRVEAAPAASAMAQPAGQSYAAQKEAPAPASVGSRSIVMQIEDLLQDSLAGTPLESRGIHLVEDPLRGVIVKVGLEQYEGIDAVPDPQIKAIIRSAVQEWEKTQ